MEAASVANDTLDRETKATFIGIVNGLALSAVLWAAIFAVIWLLFIH